MGSKTFVLGLGAQKSGTSWLHSYLSNLQGADFGFCKEYHIFDAITLPECSILKDRLELHIRTKLDKGLSVGNKVILRKCFMDDVESYFCFFNGLTAKEGIFLTGDITPSYSGLQADVLSSIKGSLEAKGFKVKPVFLMRDPVRRLQSVAQMIINRRCDREPTYDELLSKMKHLHLSRQDLMRSNYKEIVNNIDYVFNGDTFYGFYEDFFNKCEIIRLCNYLDVSYVEAPVGKVVNKSYSSVTLAAVDERLFVEGYKFIYDFCKSHFGAERIDRLWRDSNGVPRQCPAH